MKKASLITALLAALILPQGWAEEVESDKTLKVRQTATVTAEPDAIFIRLVVVGQGMLTEDALKNLEEKKAAIAASLKSIDEVGDFSFARLAVRERGNRVFSSGGELAPANPEVVDQLLIQLPPNAQRISFIVDEALRNGALFNVNTGGMMVQTSVFYALTDDANAEAELLAKLRDEATKNARAAAEVMGKQLGALTGVQIDCGTRQTSSHSMIQNDWNLIPARLLAGDARGLQLSRSATFTFELK